MIGSEDASDPFIIPDLWKKSEWADQLLSDLGGSPLISLHVNANTSKNILGNVSVSAELKAESPAVDFFKIPVVFEHFGSNDGPTPSFSGLQDNNEASSYISAPSMDDVWLAEDSDQGLSGNFAQLKTWESFERNGTKNPLSKFLSEAGQSAFDEFLVTEDSPSKRSEDPDCCVVSAVAYCRCLLALAAGRASMLFAWNSKKKSFSQLVTTLKIPGHSIEALEELTGLCVDTANCFRSLQGFVNKTVSTSPSPYRVALAGAVNRVLVALQSELGNRGRRVASVLQLQAVVRPVSSILTYLRLLVKSLSNAETDEKMLACIFEEVKNCEYRETSLRIIVRQLLQTVSRPWTEFVEEWLGLKHEEGTVLTKDKPGPGKSFVRVENRAWVDNLGFDLEEPDFFLHDDKMPSFMPNDIARAIFETGKNLRFLRTTHPNHPLSKPRPLSDADSPHLQWHFDWDAIAHAEKKAAEYEAALTCAVHGQIQEAKGNGCTSLATGSVPNATSGHHDFQFFGKNEGRIQEAVLASIALLGQPPQQTIDDPITLAVQDLLFAQGDCSIQSDELAPHWSLLPVLSFGPMVTAQSRLVNRACTELLFISHSLRDHFDLQKQYHLLCNGMFCSRLTQALFDPDLNTAERKTGVALIGGNMGLRLSGRENWPPASSELRLVLIGILSDSYRSSGTSFLRGAVRSTSGHEKSDLSEHMSFALRDLTPEEIDRCMDPHSLEALDFLRLSYKPPSALQSVMTPMILLKYDLIFKMLLRLMRMLYLVTQLFRAVQGRSAAKNHRNVDLRFRIEAHHFITQIMTYFFETGIEVPWRRFESLLDNVEAGLGLRPHKADKESIGEPPSPERLRELHDCVLDDVMLGLLLRKRQQPVMKLLEDIFGVILAFSRTHMDHSGSSREKMSDGPEFLYAAFRKKVDLFLTVCRGMSEKSKFPDPGGAQGSENTIERLILMLNLGGFYSKRV